MTRLATAAAALLVAATVTAGEHPKEHPTAAPVQAGEHSRGHERPVGSKQWTKQMNAEFNEAVESYVAQRSADGGFKIHDHELNKQWALNLIGVHKKRIVHLGDQRFFACADFKTVEKGTKDKLDLDFYATKGQQGWTIDKVLIHKVNGQPRYTYNDRNEMVPTGAEKSEPPAPMKNLGSP